LNGAHSTLCFKADVSIAYVVPWPAVHEVVLPVKLLAAVISRPIAAVPAVFRTLGDCHKHT
jgi:hypothetical protein